MKRIWWAAGDSTGHSRQARRGRATRFVAGFILLWGALLFVGPPRPAVAANYRTWIAQQASQPVPGQVVRVWVNSDTAPGETAGLQYCLGSQSTCQNGQGTGYTMVHGTFDNTHYAGANWYADIPASLQTMGALVSYQLFTYNQSNQPYGFTGFNWSYTVTDIHWTGLLHDTFNSAYRTPFGPLAEGTPVTIKFRTEHYNVTTVVLRVYQLNADHETSTMADYNIPYSSNDGTYDYWQNTFTMPSVTTIWYYKFMVLRGNDGINSGAGSITDWYSDDYADQHDNLHLGGTGTPAHSEPGNSFQLTVYDPAFQTPAWLQNAVIYQIFPDRFRNGDTSNDPLPNNRFFYGNITATLHTTWNQPPEDGRVTGQYNRDFFGGDLQGVMNKLDYLQNQGITAIYFTPIVQASSNHRYDTDNYEAVDPYLGNPALFQALASGAAARGIHLILDGVYNHTSSDSLYFDRYHRYVSDGGCESLTSFFRPWYTWNNNLIPCNDTSYNGWFGYPSLAVMDKTQPAVRDYIFGASNDTLLPPGTTQNVTQYWYGLGAGGFRFDVADDGSFHHTYWQAFRPKAKGTTSTWGKSDGPLIGEIWPNASPWLLGDELDSVMNYRFRKNVLGFARYPYNWTDNDYNGTNVLVPLLPSQFDTTLKSIREDYPPAAQYAMMNLIDSHDTNRALYVLKFSADPDLSLAKARLRLTATFQFTYLGAPTIYYGDEAGLYAPGQVDAQGVLQDDPYNRATFPWPDTSGYPGYQGAQDLTLTNYYSRLASIRSRHAALRTGDFRTLLTDDTNFVYSFGRSDANEKMVVALNNNTATVSAITIPVAGYIANGTVLTDALTGNSYTVSGGNVVIGSLAAKGAVILSTAGTAQTQWTAASGVPGAALAAPGIAWDSSYNTQVFLGGNSGLEQEYTGAGARVWSDNLHGATQARSPIIPVAGANRVLMTTQDGWVTMLNATDGSLYWQTQIAGSVVAGAAYGPGTGPLGHGLVFAGTYTDTAPAGNVLYTLDATTGSFVWSAACAGCPSGGFGLFTTRPTVDISNNVVYFGTKDVTGGSGHGVWAVRATDGALLASNTLIGAVNTSVPTLSGDNQTLYVATESAGTYTLYALNTQLANLPARWTFLSPGGPFRGVLWEDGNNLYASAGDRLYRLNKATGAPDATWNPAGGGLGYAAVPGAGSPLVLSGLSTPSVNVSGNDGNFYQLKLADGTPIRQVNLGTGAVGDPTYDFVRDAFYLGFGGALYSIWDSY